MQILTVGVVAKILKNL